MRVVICGAGIGGLTLAALLHRAGHDVELVEKAGAFGDIGAGIQISPNGSRILAAIDLSESLARVGTTPRRIVARRWQDDRELMAQPMGTAPIERYGFAYYNIYRPDLIDMLAAAAADVPIRFEAEVVDAHDTGSGAVLELAGGDSVEADVAVGADGIHSAVRDSLFGQTPSRFSELVAYRALVPRERVAALPIEATNRQGPGQHLVSYFVGEQQRYLNLVCIVPELHWDLEGWNEPGSLADLRAHFADWSPTLNAVLDEVREPIFRWALHDRPPLEQWGDGRVTLLGDACHAMLPFMAQGACQGMEDAAILCRLLNSADRREAPEALARYARIRQPRAAELQKRSWNNATIFHLPDGAEQQRRDARYAAVARSGAQEAFDWLYGYDALTAELS